MTVTEFIAKWRRVDLTERSASQQHFLDVCALVDQEPSARYVRLVPADEKAATASRLVRVRRG